MFKIEIIFSRHLLNSLLLLFIIIKQNGGQSVDKSVTLESIGIPQSVPKGAGCTPPANGCDPEYWYRSFDGTCNNLKNPLKGSWRTPYARILKAKYADDISLPFAAKSDTTLPSTRLISLKLFPENGKDDPSKTLAFNAWGQFLTHDLSLTLFDANDFANAGVNCCDQNGQFGQDFGKKPSCFPILVPPEDPVFKNRRCMNFVRTVTDIDTGCNNGHGPANPLSAVSAFIDLSHVYGPSNEAANGIREHQKGRLLGLTRHNKFYPMANPNVTATCELPAQNEPCYFFPDARGNQNPWLVSNTIFFTREHNRVAESLALINPQWDDETLYQESRNIVISEAQHIHAYGYWPKLLGTGNLLQSGLLKEGEGYFDDYNEEDDPSIYAEFSHSAFRLPHSSIPGHFFVADEDRNHIGDFLLSDNYNRPLLVDLSIDNVVRGMCTQAQEQNDVYTTVEVTNKLFPAKSRDLIAVDKQRERDFGLPSYNDYREKFGLPRAKSMQDFLDHISEEDLNKIIEVYGENPDNVDLGVGGPFEKHQEGSMQGPTFHKIMMEQMKKVRQCDRFWYEHKNGHPHPFTENQLKEIKKASLSRIYCDNGDNILRMQKDAFLIVNDENPLFDCTDTENIPIVNLEEWKSTDE